MSINENVLIKFDVQTQQAIAALAKMSKGMDGVGDAAKKAEEKTNGGLDRMTAGLLKFQAGIFAVEKVVQGLSKVLEFGKAAEEMDKLHKVVSDKLLASIQEATNGVVSQMDIMREASKALSGDMKLTEVQIADVFKASKNLADKGFGDVTENAEKLFKSLRKGTTESLAEFGLEVGTATGRAQKFDASMRAIQKAASDTTGLNASSDAVARLITQFKDLADTLARILGGAVQTLAGILEGLKPDDAEDEAMRRADKRARAEGDPGRASRYYDEELKRVKAENTREIVFGKARASGPALFTGTDYVREQWTNGATGKSAPGGGAFGDDTPFSMTDERYLPPEAKKRSGADPYATYKKRSGPRVYSGPESLLGKSSMGIGEIPGGSGLGVFSGSQLGGSGSKVSGAQFDGMFGKGNFADGFKDGLGDVRKEMASLNEMGADAAQITASAINASISAAISGQMSVMKAAKMAIGQGLANKAIDWGFSGAAMLLMGNPKGIGLIALATAAGIAARAMGGGGSANIPGGKPGGGYAGASGQNSAYTGPSSVSIHTRGRGQDSVVQFDKAYRDAQARGYIPSGTGPARLVG